MVKYDKIYIEKKNDEFQLNRKEKHHKFHKIQNCFPGRWKVQVPQGGKSFLGTEKPVELGHSELGHSGMKRHWNGTQGPGHTGLRRPCWAYTLAPGISSYVQREGIEEVKCGKS